MRRRNTAGRRREIGHDESMPIAGLQHDSKAVPEMEKVIYTLVVQIQGGDTLLY